MKVGHTVVELSTFSRAAKSILTETEKEDVITAVALNPTMGEVMVGTGGVRKFRIATGGQGKSGGARVVYFYHSEGMPIYLITVFAKNQKENVSHAERNEMAKLVELLVAQYESKRER